MNQEIAPHKTEINFTFQGRGTIYVIFQNKELQLAQTKEDLAKTISTFLQDTLENDYQDGSFNISDVTINLVYSET